MQKPTALHRPSFLFRRWRQMILACFVGLAAVLSIALSRPATAAPNDFNLDNKSDLVLSNANGLVDLWLMNGTTVSSRTTLLNSPGWAVSHLADFNGDGKTDILWRNVNGAVDLWLMNGSTVLSTVGLLGATPGWQVSHVGDFNGDGKADILWRNANGAVNMWLMNGDTVAAASPLIAATPDWQVSHVGDFNGDGKADILWRHTNGVVNMWLMNGGAVTSAAGLLGPNADWRVSHLADFNGDGRADILWRHTNGVVNMWLMNGGAVTSAAVLLGPNADWRVSHLADFNGDGKADILWRNTNGAVTMWLMNGGTVSSAVGLLGAGTGWQVVQTLDLNGDKKADLIWRNDDGSINTWQMNGLTVSASSNLLGAGGWQAVLNTGNPAPVITSNKLPTVNLTTPTSGTVSAMGIGITITANAADSDGVVRTVEFFDDSTKLGESTTPPYTFTWLPSNEGTRTITARAIDNGNGSSTALASVTITFSPALNASRFLSQATFGAKMADIDALAASSPADWLNTQFAKPQTLHLPQTSAYLATLTPDNRRGQTGFIWSIWRNFSTADDQLRQRIAFALSEMMVISLSSNDLSFGQPYGPANYLDRLGANAFGNFRTLLQDVTYSPMMGIYLTHLRNRKENPVTGAVPDENYAREVMQLMTIGLYQLNLDGTQKLDGAGKPIDTYSNVDISGLAKVFTGLSWAGPDTSDSRFRSGGGSSDVPDHQITPMQAYNQYHSTSQKQFLGVTIPATTVADTNADVKIALDTLFNHPNVGPFFGKQLIQRLVTANPSPAYVSRVATAFNNNGAGVRGDMKAVIRAVLLDPEARNPGATNTSGKLREPVIRFVHWMRAFNARSQNGQFLLGGTSDPSSQLAQTPMSAPSVFNFFRPGFIPPNSKIGALGLVSPESQITSETSVAGYLNFMRSTIQNGVGTQTNGIRDILPDYTQEIALANDADKLIDRVSLLLTAGGMSANTRAQIRTAINSVAIRTLAADAETDRRNRVYLAIYLTMASPEYILQN